MTQLVVATAGHVDHGKSALVTALTGMPSDRLAEEQHRSLTLTLGYSWLAVGDESEVALIDVPGHADYTHTTLRGLGQARAVLLVVAADEGWAAQTAEHVAAINALGIERGIVAITKSDAAPATAVAAEVRARLADTGLSHAAIVSTSARTGHGIAALTRALADLSLAGAAECHQDPARLWVDRSFTVPGTGTVVTGTLTSGTLRAGASVSVAGRRSRVRTIESLGRARAVVSAPARVALALPDLKLGDIGTGDTVTEPGSWRASAEVDVALDQEDHPPSHATLHLGSAALAARVRPLGHGFARLYLARGLGVRVGDHGLLRDPGQRRIVAGVRVVDPAPLALTRRGDARRLAEALAQDANPPALVDYLRRRGAVRADAAARLGFRVDAESVRNSEWLFDPGLETALSSREALEGVPLPEWGDRLGLDDPAALRALASARGLLVRSGRVMARVQHSLGQWEPIVAALECQVSGLPLCAPTRPELDNLAIPAEVLAAAQRAGRLVRLTQDVLLSPAAIDEARTALAALEPNWTVAQARLALGTSRRITLALCAHLDALGVTLRLPDDRRRFR